MLLSLQRPTLDPGLEAQDHPGTYLAVPAAAGAARSCLFCRPGPRFGHERLVPTLLAPTQYVMIEAALRVVWMCPICPLRSRIFLVWAVVTPWPLPDPPIGCGSCLMVPLLLFCPPIFLCGAGGHPSGPKLNIPGDLGAAWLHPSHPVKRPFLLATMEATVVPNMQIICCERLHSGSFHSSSVRGEAFSRISRQIRPCMPLWRRPGAIAVWARMCHTKFTNYRKLAY